MRTSARVAFGVGVISLALVAVAHAQTPTCETLDLSGRAASSFKPAAEFVVRGAGLAPNELVLVTFRQAPAQIELARYKTDAQGAFTSRPRIIRIPSDASAGMAAIHLASSQGSATCDAEIVGASAVAPSPTSRADEQRELEPWFVAWGTLLALGAVGLAYARYRRWRQARLERQISGLAEHQEPGRGIRLGE